MMPVIKKILYTTDLSPNATFVLRYAINSAIQHNASIVILHVLEELPAAARSWVFSYMSDEDQKKIFQEAHAHAMEQINDRLKMFYQKELSENPTASERIEKIEVHEGYPADRILKTADEFDCDVILMGSHGKSAIYRTFLGSVTKQVLRRTRKPVFIIPLPRAGVDRYRSSLHAGA